MPTFQLDGRRLHFTDTGEGPPVLLLHGFPLSGQSYRHQIAALSGRYRVLVPDLRGFGQSEGGDEVATMERFARDAIALLDHLRVPRLVVGGLSMGGYVAMAMLREDAGRVAGLMLFDTQAGADDEAGRRKREETAQQVLSGGMDVLVQGMVPRLLGKTPDPVVRSEVTSLILANTPRGAAAALRGMAERPESLDVLSRFAGPALVVRGVEDAITPLERAQELARVLSGSALVEIAGAGHLPNQEVPDVFNAAVLGFLDRTAG
jgi:pimeloyl-ACP methyl ester carboxylesterase